MNFNFSITGKGPGYRFVHESETEKHEYFGARNLPVRGIQNDPPATMVAFDDFVVGGAPTGAWAGKATQIARVEEDDTGALSWGFYPVDDDPGASVLNEADDLTYRFRAGAWAPVPGGEVTANDPAAFHPGDVGKIAALQPVVATPAHNMLVEDAEGVLRRAAVPAGGGGGGGGAALALVSSTPLTGGSVTIPLPTSNNIEVHVEGLKLSANDRAELSFSDGSTVFNTAGSYRGSYHQLGVGADYPDAAIILLGSSNSMAEVEATIRLTGAATSSAATKYQAISRTLNEAMVHNNGRRNGEEATTALVLYGGGKTFTGGKVEVWAA